MPESTRYQYQPIRADREIRVFVLYNDTFESPIAGRLERVSLATPPAYNALSYAWGRPNRDWAVVCNGKQLLVPRSLYVALKELRRDPNGSRQVTIWADAMCINQDDKDEKTPQLRNMDEIYRKAAAVDVWLGEASADSDLAMSFVADLVKKLLPLQDRDRGSLGELYGNYGIPAKDHKAWFALSTLLARPWFERAWVVQEVALGSNVMVHCGARGVSWDCFSTLVALFSRFRLIIPGERDPTRRDYIESLVLFNEMKKSIGHNKKLNLVSLLRATRYFRTSAPEDKIISVMGLTRDAPAYTQHIDAKLSALDVFRGVAEKMVLRGDTIEMLSQVRYPRTLLSLNTWVPDWTFNEALVQDGASFYVLPGFAASGGHKQPTVRLSKFNTVLNIAGCVVDEVRGLTSCLRPSQSELEMVEHYMAWDEECRRLTLSNESRTKEEMQMRTRICNFSTTLEPADQSYNASYAAWREYCRMYKLLAAGVRIDLQKFQQLDVDSDKFATAQSNVALGRRLCTTRKGYAGLVPEETQPGDVVAILMGGPVPFILRKAGEECKVIGESYVHNIMHGEACRTSGFRFDSLSLI